MVGEAAVVDAAEIEQQLEINVHDTRDIFRAFDLAGHPVKRISDA
jgi:hypothetical protein